MTQSDRSNSAILLAISTGFALMLVGALGGSFSLFLSGASLSVFGWGYVVFGVFAMCCLLAGMGVIALRFGDARNFSFNDLFPAWAVYTAHAVGAVIATLAWPLILVAMTFCLGLLSRRPDLLRMEWSSEASTDSDEAEAFREEGTAAVV